MKMAALLCLLLPTKIFGQDGIDLIVPVQDKTTVIRLEITGDKEALNGPWSQFLDQLFDYFDRDGDGLLSDVESKRIFALPDADQKSIMPPSAGKLGDGKGKIDRNAFQDYYRKAGFTPLVTSVRPPKRELAQLDEILFLALDHDRDGKLSQEELASADRLLRRFDADEDEVLSPDEIRPSGIAIANKLLPRQPLKMERWDPSRTIDFGIEIEFGKDRKTPKLKLGGKSIDPIPDQSLGWQAPSVSGSSRLLVPESAARFKATREFYVSSFREALGDKSALSMRDLEDEPALQNIAATFPYADRNGDDQLTLAELEGFLNLIELGLRAQRAITIEDEGTHLFGLLDENHDGQLDRRELSHAPRLLGADQKSLTRGDLKRQVNITLSRSRPLSSLGSVRLAVVRNAIVEKRPLKKTGPHWFQAMDANGDGYLSRDEFLGSPELFVQLDTDRDGFISVAEAEAKTSKKK